jgi:hypothetical protein
MERFSPSPRTSLVNSNERDKKKEEGNRHKGDDIPPNYSAIQKKKLPCGLFKPK